MWWALAYIAFGVLLCTLAFRDMANLPPPERLYIFVFSALTWPVGLFVAIVRALR